MNIARIHTTPLALAFKEPYHWAGRVDHAAAVVLVEVETDDGLVGIGESVSAFPAEGTVAALQGVAPLFVGQSVYDVERLISGARHLGSFNRTPWHAGFVLAGLEMALWDLQGKIAGLPVHQLLGGAVREAVDYFGFVQGDTTEELVEDARDLAAAGYGVIYLKVGRGEAADLANTAAVREVVGDLRLRLDPNCAWSVAEAIHMIRRLERFEPEWIEQPTPLQSIAALRQVREAVRVPIARRPGGLRALRRVRDLPPAGCRRDRALTARGRRPARLRQGRRHRRGRRRARVPAVRTSPASATPPSTTWDCARRT